MAQFTVRGRVKPLFNGDGVSVGFEVTGPPVVRGAYRGVLSEALQLQELKLTFSSARSGSTSSTRVYANASASSSSAVGKWKKFRSNDLLNVNKEEVWEEIVDESDYDKDDLSSFRGLVLDISYRPVNVVCWKRAICLEFMEKADVLEYYDQTVNSPSGSYYIPAVLRVPHLIQIVKRRRIKKSLSRKNILRRDGYMCQYCSSDENLTIDHVLPIARGGEWTWENLVVACSRCNSRKGHKTPEEANMKLMRVPKAPKDYDVLAIPLTGSAFNILRSKKGIPEEWREYLSMQSAAP